MQVALSTFLAPRQSLGLKCHKISSDFRHNDEELFRKHAGHKGYEQYKVVQGSKCVSYPRLCFNQHFPSTFPLGIKIGQLDRHFYPYLLSEKYKPRNLLFASNSKKGGDGWELREGTSPFRQLGIAEVD